MEMTELSRKVFLIPGAVNMGAVVTDEGIVAIDTGLDKQSGKKLVRLAETIGKPICAIINTHAHADHFGGNAYILSQNRVCVYAPVGEAPVIRRPRFEPEYLWQGTAPFPDLENKFLLAEPSPVDVEMDAGTPFDIGNTTFTSIALPGHAHHQVGILVDDVFFAADAYFDIPVSEKHGLPFMVSMEETISSASLVTQTTARTYVPGHGKPTDDPKPHVDFLVERHREAFGQAMQMICAQSLSLEVCVRELCKSYNLDPQNAGSYLLIRTTVAAYLTQGMRQGIIQAGIENGMLMFTGRA